MRKFLVWANELQHIMEFNDHESQRDIELALEDCLQTLIENEVDSGWNEIEEETVQ